MLTALLQDQVSQQLLNVNIKLQIKNRFTGSLLFEYESENNTIKETLLQAIKAKAYLRGANLYAADLRGADLSAANLHGANLYGAKEIPIISIAQTRICAEGDIIGYKKCLNGIIVKLLIPKDAKRNNAFGRKCRAEYAQVLEVIGADKAISQHDNSFTYKVGDIVRPTEPFDEDFANECSTGINFFITLEEAKNY